MAIYLDENGNEIITKSLEEKRMIAEQMRQRAKEEFAQDMEAQTLENKEYIGQQYKEITQENIILPVVGISFVFLYFLPTYIAWKRKQSKKKISMIFMINCFAGWTFLLWLMCAIWSLSDFELK